MPADAGGRIARRATIDFCAVAKPGLTAGDRHAHVKLEAARPGAAQQPVAGLAQPGLVLRVAQPNKPIERGRWCSFHPQQAAGGGRQDDLPSGYRHAPLANARQLLDSRGQEDLSFLKSLAVDSAIEPGSASCAASSVLVPTPQRSCVRGGIGRCAGVGQAAGLAITASGPARSSRHPCRHGWQGVSGP